MVDGHNSLITIHIFFVYLHFSRTMPVKGNVVLTNKVF